MSKRRVSYFYDNEVGSYYYGQEHPMKPFRIKMAHQLIVNYGLYRRMNCYVRHLSSCSCRIEPQTLKCRLSTHLSTSHTSSKLHHLCLRKMRNSRVQTWRSLTSKSGKMTVRASKECSSFLKFQLEPVLTLPSNSITRAQTLQSTGEAAYTMQKNRKPVGFVTLTISCLRFSSCSSTTTECFTSISTSTMAMAWKKHFIRATES